MNFDIFFSICHTPVNGFLPTEKKMFENFFSQVEAADRLGFETAWVAESHLSCEVQKKNSHPVIPHFEGEIGLNTDVLQLAHRVFAKTKRINVGSAIRNILCNGGPIAHAEAVRTFLSLHNLDDKEQRKLHLGFASGRFPFSNAPYGIFPRNEVEKSAWPQVRGHIFKEATEIFLRLLKGETFSSSDLERQFITVGAEKVPLAPRWNFDKLAIVPKNPDLRNLWLTVGSHDPSLQIFANTLLPCGVFNLSITPVEKIEETHERMKTHFHKSAGPWSRSYMPRTSLIFIDEHRKRAIERAQEAISVYWSAMEGTISKEKIDEAVGNALVGTPEEIVEQIKVKFNSEDRVMLWFDFFNHDNENVLEQMELFSQKVVPQV